MTLWSLARAPRCWPPLAPAPRLKHTREMLPWGRCPWPFAGRAPVGGVQGGGVHTLCVCQRSGKVSEERHLRCCVRALRFWGPQPDMRSARLFPNGKCHRPTCKSLMLSSTSFGFSSSSARWQCQTQGSLFACKRGCWVTGAAGVAALAGAGAALAGAGAGATGATACRPQQHCCRTGRCWGFLPSLSSLTVRNLKLL